LAGYEFLKQLFDLEDKVLFNEGNIVVPPTIGPDEEV